MTDQVALYLRVSTQDQDLVGQERDLRGYAASRGWEVGAVYSEKISASGRVERAALEQLRIHAHSPARNWRRVLVWALDRWSREPSFVRAIGSIEELEQLGVRFHSFREPALDSSEDDAPNLARDLLRGILPTIAAFEARRRSERTRVAMREIKDGRRKTRSGLPPGRPPRITPELLASIDQLRSSGLTWAQVALRLHVPATSARKWHSAARKGGTTLPGENPRVINGPEGFGAASPASADLPSRR